MPLRRASQGMRHRGAFSLVTMAFQVLAVTLEGEIDTLAYPKAALFGFCVALVAYNLMAATKAALFQVGAWGRNHRAGVLRLLPDRRIPYGRTGCYHARYVGRSAREAMAPRSYHAGGGLCRLADEPGRAGPSGPLQEASSGVEGAFVQTRL